MIHGFGIAPKVIQEREGKRRQCIQLAPQKCLEKEWAEKRSVTLRCHIRDEHKTLIKEEIDQVMQKLVSVADELGAVVR